MQFTRLGSARIRRFMAYASTSVVVSLAAAGMTVQAQPSATPTLSVPDVTQVVEQSEGSVVNVRTTESVPVRRRPMGPGGNDPYEMFRWFFGRDFAPPGLPGPLQRSTPATDEERTVPRGVGSG